MEYYLTCREDTLQHFGTRGMKWGRRQYQYQDGTYTPAGKVRYGIGDGHSHNGTHNSKNTQNSQSNSSRNLSRKEKKIARGKELYEKGETKPSVLVKNILQQTAVAGGATLGQLSIAAIMNHAGADIGTINTVNYGISLGASGVNSILAVKGAKDLLSMRAYEKYELQRYYESLNK